MYHGVRSTLRLASFPHLSLSSYIYLSINRSSNIDPSRSVLVGEIHAAISLEWQGGCRAASGSPCPQLGDAGVLIPGAISPKGVAVDGSQQHR